MTVVPDCRAAAGQTVHVQVTQQQGNDLGPVHILRTSDNGKKWSLPAESMNLDKTVLPDDVFETPWLAPLYHKKSGKMLGYGNTVFSRDDSFNSAAKNEMLVHELLPGRHNIFSIWDDDAGDWDGWGIMQESPRITEAGLTNLMVQCCNQTVELENGTILLPAAVKKDEWNSNRIATLICNFDGREWRVEDMGNSIGTDDSEGRGYHEPSMIEFGGVYFLTIRSDREDFRMYCSRSADGIVWDEMSPWTWDDGTEIKTENTQQHFLKHADQLYLVYTRVNENSNGVFRSRAPLFIAQVDTERLCLIRESERVVFPAKDGRMGNFTVAAISENEAWVMTGEWVEQNNPAWHPGKRFYCEIESNGQVYNRNQYIGDMLLARLFF